MQRLFNWNLMQTRLKRRIEYLTDTSSLWVLDMPMNMHLEYRTVINVST